MPVELRACLVYGLMAAMAVGCTGNPATTSESSADPASRAVRSEASALAQLPSKVAENEAPSRADTAETSPAPGGVPLPDPDAKIRDRIRRNIASNARPKTPGTAGWNRSALRPIEIAARAEKALRDLDRGEAATQVMALRPEGITQHRGRIEIKGRGAFSAQYVVFGKTEEEGADSRRLVVEPSGLYADSDAVGAPMKPISRFPYPNRAEMVLAWRTEYPRLFLAAMVRGKTPISDLIRDAEASGFSVSSEDRTAEVRGRAVNNQRIFIRGQMEGETMEMELVFDSTTRLPVAFRTHMDEDIKKGFYGRWMARWDLGGEAKAEDALWPGEKVGSGA